MKKIIMVIMVLMVMVFNLAGCGNESNTKEEFEYDRCWRGQNGKVYFFATDTIRYEIIDEMSEHGNLTKKDIYVRGMYTVEDINYVVCYANLEFEDGFNIGHWWSQNMGTITDKDLYTIVL